MRGRLLPASLTFSAVPVKSGSAEPNDVDRTRPATGTIEPVDIVAPASETKPFAAAAVTVIAWSSCSASQYLPAGTSTDALTVTNPSEVVATAEGDISGVVGLPSEAVL